MIVNFSASLSLVLAHEGGFVNNPKDPGGPTNRGITQRVYDKYRAAKSLPLRSVSMLSSSETEVAEIYRNQYWGATCDKLPTGIDYAVFDFSVNSGCSRAIKMLQHCLGVAEDGVFGNASLTALNGVDQTKLINDYCDARLDFLRDLSTFATFGKGWTRRVEEVRHTALSMANNTLRLMPAPMPAQGKAFPPPTKAPVAIISGAAIAGTATLKVVQHYPNPLPYIIGAAIVAIVIVCVLLMRGNK